MEFIITSTSTRYKDLFYLLLPKLFQTSDMQYHLDGNPITAKVFYEDLCVIFSSDLSWSKYFEYIVFKAYHMLINSK